MAINQVQMQPGLSLAEFIQHYGTEVQCEHALAIARWPRGFACPACRCRLHTTFQRAERSYWQCQRCHHQTTVTAGTIFEINQARVNGLVLGHASAHPGQEQRLGARTETSARRELAHGLACEA